MSDSDDVTSDDSRPPSDQMVSSSDSEEVIIKRRRRNKADHLICSKLTLPDHLAAHMEERDLDRDIEPLECSEDTIERVFSNYVIVKNILSHLRWQEKLISKDVCLLWNSAVKTLQNEQLGPVDFLMEFTKRVLNKKVKVEFQKSSEFHTEPMAIFTFCTMADPLFSIECDAISPPPCSPACSYLHCPLDAIYQETTAPKDCMYIVKAQTISYLPLPQTKNMRKYIREPRHISKQFMYGLYIPKISGVEFRMLSSSNSTQEKLITEIKSLTANYIVKGVVACLTDNYLLYMDQQNAECLHFLHDMQPGIPFAFGGCLVGDTVNGGQDLSKLVDCLNKDREYISGNVMSLGIFLTPKEDSSSRKTSTSEEPKQNFEIYSFVMKSTVWSKPAIQQAIKEFSQQVPRFEHSVALKLSCTGRQNKHDVEQQSFRNYFPNTRLAGCFGNGELGVTHLKSHANAPAATKRVRENIPYDEVHSYSTIFFYIGWGKIFEGN